MRTGVSAFLCSDRASIRCTLYMDRKTVRN